MIKLLIVDDHEVIRDGLKKILALEPLLSVEGTAGNAREAIEFVSSVKVDVIILDISMPGRSGLEIISEILSIQSTARIIMLTMHKEIQIAMQAFNLGASGYLTKELAPDEIVAAIHTVHCGQRYTCPGFECAAIQQTDITSIALDC
jgi:two-component system, NarL family, invasion response regulator UvrY